VLSATHCRRATDYIGGAGRHHLWRRKMDERKSELVAKVPQGRLLFWIL
jgi:hypothetical protein